MGAGDLMARTAMQARPTIYKGIQMRSRMEAEFAAHLDSLVARWPEDYGSWHYEPMCFAGAAGQYLPDFRLDTRRHDGTPYRLYIETKPIVEDWSGIADRMEVIWESESTAGLALYELRGEMRGWVAENGEWWFYHPDFERVRVR